MIRPTLERIAEEIELSVVHGNTKMQLYEAARGIIKMFEDAQPNDPTEQEIEEVAFLKISDDYSGYGGFSPKDTWIESINWYKSKIGR